MLGITLLLAGCSGNKQKASGDSDSAFIEEAELAADSVTIPDLTAKGLGPLTVGMSLDSIPEGVAGLYDIIDSDGTPDALVYTFMLGDQQMFEAFTFDGKTLDMISIDSPEIPVSVSGGTLHLGDPMVNLLKLRGVTTEYVTADDSGQWYWRYEGLWFYPDPAKCSEKLIEALGNNHNPPSASLVPDDLPIGFIATGLPF